MPVRNLVRRNEYRDSVILMKASEHLRAVEGVVEAALMMGTSANRRILSRIGLLSGEGRSAQPDDLIIAVEAVDEKALVRAFSRVDELLASQGTTIGKPAFRLLDSAVKAMPDANLAIISVPGRFAAREARKALEYGLHVFLFSDDVPIEMEVELKTMAKQQGLLVMGPECGTAIINNACIGFANAVRRGPVGIVGASGTGIQEVSVLIHRQGSGISQAIGVGGRDLSDEVGGISMLQALDALEQDALTEVIVLLSKPPSLQVMEEVLNRASRCVKPVIVSFLGATSGEISQIGVMPAVTLEEAALRAVAVVMGDTYQESESALLQTGIKELIDRELKRFSPGQKYVRGLFSGGTLCYEAMLILQEYVGAVHSNVPLSAEFALVDAYTSHAHTVIDMGDKGFTQGHPHPMIDPWLRKARILQEAQDREVAVLLLDIVLGYGSHPDPAGALVGFIVEAKAQVSERGGHLSVVASVCGTEQDVQNLAVQEEQLREAGVIVMPSNAQASRLAGLIASAVRPK